MEMNKCSAYGQVTVGESISHYDTVKHEEQPTMELNKCSAYGQVTVGESTSHYDTVKHEEQPIYN